MTWLLKLLLQAGAVVLWANVLPGVHLRDYLSAMIVVLVLGLLNAFLKPILVFLTLPLTIVTLGLFLVILNVLMVMLADALIPGLQLDGFVYALIFGFLVGITHAGIERALERKA